MRLDKLHLMEEFPKNSMHKNLRRRAINNLEPKAREQTKNHKKETIKIEIKFFLNAEWRKLNKSKLQWSAASEVARRAAQVEGAGSSAELVEPAASAASGAASGARHVVSVLASVHGTKTDGVRAFRGVLRHAAGRAGAAFGVMTPSSTARSAEQLHTNANVGVSESESATCAEHELSESVARERAETSETGCFKYCVRLHMKEPAVLVYFVTRCTAHMNIYVYVKRVCNMQAHSRSSVRRRQVERRVFRGFQPTHWSLSVSTVVRTTRSSTSSGNNSKRKFATTIYSPSNIVMHTLSTWTWTCVPCEADYRFRFSNNALHAAHTHTRVCVLVSWSENETSACG